MSSIDKFVNPYNFVPFGNGIDEKRTSREKTYRDKEKLLSGWLELRIDLKTPLIIPDGAHPEFWDINTDKRITDVASVQDKSRIHKKYNFMRLPNENGQDEYAIPGSELRGMIRSVYEAASDSCLPFLMDDKPMSQRVPTFSALNKRGLLAYDKLNKRWILYSTHSTKDEVLVDAKGTMRFKDSGKEVNVKPGDFVPHKGIVQYNVPVDKRKAYFIRYLTANESIYSWESTEKPENSPAYKSVKSELMRDGAPKGNNPNRSCQMAELDCLERAALYGGKKNMVPVFYFIVKDGTRDIVYMSCSSIGRIAQRRKWKEIMGKYAPCTSTSKLCPACLLFGTIQDKGMKGHLRFTDARVDCPEKVKTENHLLQILGAPRTSAFEFYLRRPNNATYWNFDFYSTTVRGRNGKPYVEYHHLEQATPRGRKMYWHGPVATDASRPTNLNSTMEAIQGGVFHSKVYFDQVTQQQLDDLAWVITLGENKADSTKQHKLGHAKSLGYGSIKVTIEHCMIREISDRDGHLSVTVNEKEIAIDQHSFDMQSDTMQSLLCMCDAESIQDVISYPCSSNFEEPVFKWFADNRMNAKNLVVLPEPTDDNMSLETVKPKNGQSRMQNNRTDIKTMEKPDKALGQLYEGVIVGHNKSGRFANVHLINGKKASFYDCENRAEGTRVQLEYAGKNKDGYPSWKLVKVFEN